MGGSDEILKKRLLKGKKKIHEYFKLTPIVALEEFDLFMA